LQKFIKILFNIYTITTVIIYLLGTIVTEE